MYLEPLMFEQQQKIERVISPCTKSNKKLAEKIYNQKSL